MYTRTLACAHAQRGPAVAPLCAQVLAASASFEKEYSVWFDKLWFAPPLIRVMRNFCNLPGSDIYKMFENGELVYFVLRLRKKGQKGQKDAQRGQEQDPSESTAPQLRARSKSRTKSRSKSPAPRLAKTKARSTAGR